MFSTVWNTQRGSWNYIEKRRGRRVIEVTKQRRGEVKRGETNLASNQLPKEEKGMTEDEMVGWHHQLNGHGFGWTPGDGEGQGGLAC